MKRFVFLVSTFLISCQSVYAQDFELVAAPQHGIVEQNVEGGGFCYVGESDTNDFFSLKTIGDNPTTFGVVITELGTAEFNATIDGRFGVKSASYRLMDWQATDLSSDFIGEAPVGMTVMCLIVNTAERVEEDRSGGRAGLSWIEKGVGDVLDGLNSHVDAPNRYTELAVVSTSNTDTDGFPDLDDGKYHGDIPEDIDLSWDPETIRKAIENLDESIKNRTDEIEWHFGGDDGHKTRIDWETGWRDRLQDRLDGLTKMTIGGTLMWFGSGAITTGVVGSGVIIADDVTVIGVADDPLLVVTGGVMVVGGAIWVTGGIIDFFGF